MPEKQVGLMAGATKENKPPVCAESCNQERGIGLACFLPLEGHTRQTLHGLLPPDKPAALLESPSLHPGLQLLSPTLC